MKIIKRLALTIALATIMLSAILSESEDKPRVVETFYTDVFIINLPDFVYHRADDE